MPLKTNKTPETPIDPALKQEAEELGINLSRASDGTYTASVVGGQTLESYPDARQVVDDMAAIIAMDENQELYTYEDDGLGGARVTVNGNGHFDAPYFAQAFAQAQNHVLSQQAKPVPEPEIMPPERPQTGNGSAVASVDREQITTQLLIDLAKLLTEAAHKFQVRDSVQPFVPKDFRDEAAPLPSSLANLSNPTPPPAKGRVTREKRTK